MKKEYVTPQIEIEAFTIDSTVCAQSDDKVTHWVAYEQEEKEANNPVG